MYKLWFASPKHPEPQREQRWREQAKSWQIPHQHGPIACYQWGESDRRVLLIHGWSGRGPQLAGFVEPLLAQGYEVIAFDAPGHGRTPGKTSSIFRITDALMEVVKQTGAVEAVITHSFGAMVMAYAIKHAGLDIKKAVCLSSPTTPEYLVDRFCEVMQVDEKVNKAFRGFVQKRFGDDVFDRLSADKNMSGSQIPALIIHDQDDHDVPYTLGQQLADAWPRATLHLTNDLGHRRILRNRKITNMIVDFIAES
ncbi:MAG: alpha/beta hydrolase [Gammaproteobacteria bacterium]|nr:alpha/beta hydrolase [Gammaproteobacteria bacterium]